MKSAPVILITLGDQFVCDRLSLLHKSSDKESVKAHNGQKEAVPDGDYH